MFGSGTGCKNIICITLGTGIGCGLIINGRIYRGTSNICGELGHSIVSYNGEMCSCGQRGCLEAYAAGPAIVRLAKEHIKSYEQFIQNDKNDLTAEDVFAMARSGNTAANEIIQRAVEYIGICLVNLSNILGPEKIIISGGMCKENELFLEPIRKIVLQKSYPLIADKIKIEKAKLGEDAPMMGASILCRIPEVRTAKDVLEGEVIAR